MRYYAKTSWAALQTPEIFLAISGMREESFVFALEIYRKQKVNISAVWRLRNIAAKLPVPGSGVVGGSGVVSLLLNDFSFELLLVSSLRRACFLRFRLELDRSFDDLLLFLLLGPSFLFAVLTAFPLSELSSSSEDGSYDRLSTR